MATMAFADDPPCRHIQRGEQRRRPVPNVVVRTGFDVPGSHRQQRLRPIERLNLRLFVDAKDDRSLGRRHIEADDVAHLLDEERILRQLERRHAVGLESERAPDTTDCRLTHRHLVGHRSRAPVRRRFRLRFERARDHSLDVGIFDLPRRARSRLIQQTIGTALQEAAAPLADGRTIHTGSFGNDAVVPALLARQDDPRTHRQRIRRRRAPHPPLKLLALTIRERDDSFRTTSAHRSTSVYRRTNAGGFNSRTSDSGH